jgi:hypothetical protein
MKHLSAPAMSTSSVDTLFTAPGLGDRIHLVTLGYLYSIHIQDIVSLHLTGAQSHCRNRKSFKEVLELFPNSRVNIVFHDFVPQDESDWSNFLSNLNIDAQSFHYRDHLGRHERINGIDVSRLLEKLPCLNLDNSYEQNEQKYITAQWDSTALSRKISDYGRNQVEERYRELGYEVVTIGGEANTPELKYDLRCISRVVSHAELHIGVDSAFMHLARLYLPSNRINFYIDPKGFWSHHALRLRDAGVEVNRFYIKLNIVQKIRVKVLYDSPRLYRIVNKSDKLRSTLMKSNWFVNNVRAKGHSK